MDESYVMDGIHIYIYLYGNNGFMFTLTADSTPFFSRCKTLFSR